MNYLKMKGDEMENNTKQYDIASLSNIDLQQVNSLEKKMSEEKGKEVVLVAYQENNNE